MAKLNPLTGQPFHYGSRNTINLLIAVLTLVQKYRSSLAEDVPGEVNEQLNGILSVLEILKTLNPPGPN